MSVEMIKKYPKTTAAKGTSPKGGEMLRVGREFLRVIAVSLKTTSDARLFGAS